MLTKVIVEGPYLTQSGYGEHARFVLRALASRKEIDLYAHPTGWGQTSWLWEDNEEREWLDQITLKTIKYIADNPQPQFDIQVRVGIPNEHKRNAPHAILVTAGIETTKISPEWMVGIRDVESIIVPSQHAKTGFESTTYEVPKQTSHIGTTTSVQEEKVTVRCETPVHVVSYPVRVTEPDLEFKQQLDFSTDFNFLSIAQWSPRKNIFSSVKWFLEEFKNEEVGLILKANQARNCHLDFVKTRDMISKFVEQNSSKDRKCKIHFLHGDLTEAQMASLYTHDKVKAIVTTSHGEGFGLPLFEAANYALPVVSPGWGGQVDFLTAPVKAKGSNRVKRKNMYAKVKYTLGHVQKEAVWKGMILPDSMWCFAEEASFKNMIRDVHNNHGMHKARAKKLKKHLEAKCAEEKVFRQLSDIVLQPLYEKLKNLTVRNIK